MTKNTMIKKSLILILFLTCFAITKSFSNLVIKNNTNCAITVHLTSYDLATCNYDGNQSVSVASNSWMIVNTVSSTSEWLHAKIGNDLCSSQSSSIVGIETNGLGGCLPCLSFGLPNLVNYNFCSSCQPFTANWQTFCSGNTGLDFY